MSLPEKLRQCQMSMSSAKMSKSVNCDAVLRQASDGHSGQQRQQKQRSSSVVDDSGRPINWLSREGGGGVIQVAVALETIWLRIDGYLGRNGRGTTGRMYVCMFVCVYVRICVWCVYVRVPQTTP